LVHTHWLLHALHNKLNNKLHSLSKSSANYPIATYGWALLKARSKTILTYAWSHGRSGLLVTFGTSIARYSGHSIFTRALTSGLVACFSWSTHWVTIARWIWREKAISIKWQGIGRIIGSTGG